jgi:signal transduction histidine kinase
MVSDTDRTLADRLLASAAELGLRATDGTSPEELFLAAAHAVTALLQIDVASVWELRPENVLALRSTAGAVEGMAAPQGEPHLEAVTDSPVGRALVTRGPVVIHDLRLDRQYSETSFLARQQLRCSLIVPIFAGPDAAGALGAHTRAPREFKPIAWQFLQILAQAISAPFSGNDKESEQRQTHLMRAEQMVALGQVAAGFAHELRNPLTAIKGLIQVNRKELEERRVPADDLRVIEHEIRRMERSLQNFLDFARPAVPNRQRILLSAIIERVIALVEGRARKQQVTIRIPELPGALWVNADQDLIQQLLLNLILNALDAMPQGGSIWIEARPESSDQVTVCVRDVGPGIAPHILPVIFERFVSSKETGVGLGLPVSRRIAQEHGGDLAVENLPEGGASFTFQLPIAAPEPP